MFDDLGGTHCKKVLIYAPPFQSPFSGLCKLCLVSTPIFQQKLGKCTSTPIFCQILAEWIVSTPCLALCSASSQRAPTFFNT